MAEQSSTTSRRFVLGAAAIFTTAAGYLVVQPDGIGEYHRAPAGDQLASERIILGREAVKDAWISARA